MDITTNKIEIQRTGVFYTAGILNSCNRTWFVCHGYGQLGNRIINKFDRVERLGDGVISVEAPNRFYWKGMSEQPVTTWMTSLHRLDEIRDNNKYLSDVYELNVNKDTKKILFGFSQGGTTIWRWVFEDRPDFDVFINYAGWIPEGIELYKLQDYLKNKLLIFTYGENDEYLTDERIEIMSEIIDRSGLNIIIHKTKGNHRIDRDVIDEILEIFIK